MKRILASPEQWKVAFDLVPFPVYVVDVATYEVMAVNGAMHGRGVVNGQPCYQAIYQQQGPCISCPMAALLADQAGAERDLAVEYFNEVDNRWYQLKESLQIWFDGRLVKQSIAVDISKLKETQNQLVEAHALLSIQAAELEKLAITDRLTGLCNRRRLDEILDREVDVVRRYDFPLSVIMADIDQFKSVNDTHGHQVGDEVLVAVAAQFKGGVRKTDTLGRWGGEEFMMLCPGTDLGRASGVAEQLRRRVEACDIPVVGRKTCSFGVAQLLGQESAKELIRRADGALYRAKELGRNRVETA